MDEVFKALADATRRALIDELLDSNDQTLFELCGRLIMTRNLSASRQAVSKHIAVLVAAGIVSTNPEGRTTIHHLDEGPLEDAVSWLTERTNNKEKQ